MTTATDNRASSKSAADQPALPATSNPPRRFQFRILDVVLVTTLTAMFLAAVVQLSGWLLLAFAAAGLLALLFVWKVNLRGMLQLAGCLLVLGLALCALLLPAIQSTPRSGRRSQCQNNLKQIALALHNYHDVYDSFPPAYIADASGKPMHSWRVLILPFMEQQPLYDRYRFDEPWDGPNNSQLAPAIRRAYSCPSDNTKLPTETSYVAIVGPGTAWPGETATSFQDIADGTNNTLLVVEVHNSGIQWMEPRDLHVTQMAPNINSPNGQGVSSAHPEGAHVVLVDGAVRFLRDDTTPVELRSWIHVNDGALAPLP